MDSCTHVSGLGHRHHACQHGCSWCAEQHVLEVGCGVNPLCCLAALQSARRVVCTDGSPETLERLAHNLSMNAW